MIRPSAPGTVNPEQYERIPGPERHYIHIATGEEVSRRQAMIGSSGYSPEEAVAARRGVTAAEYSQSRYEQAKARAQAEGYATPYQKAKASPGSVEYWKERAREDIKGKDFKPGRPKISMQVRRELIKRMGSDGYQRWAGGQYRRGKR